MQVEHEHWGMKNQLRWCLNVVLREDASRAKRDNSPNAVKFSLQTKARGIHLLKKDEWIPFLAPILQL